MPDRADSDEFLSLDEVFEPSDEVIRLALSDREWEVIIVLTEAGGAERMSDLLVRAGMDPETFSQVVKSLRARGILESGPPETQVVNQETERAAAVYLAGLRGKNHYEVLDVPPEAEPPQIKRAYFTLMREYHPDRFTAMPDSNAREDLKEIFRVLTGAYETLIDPQQRYDYDLTIPDFSGALDREEDKALEALMAGVATDSLPETGANPELAKSFFDSAVEAFQAGDFRAAELNFKLAAALDPDRADYREGLAKTKAKNDKTRAREAAVKAIYFEEEGKLGLAIKWMNWAAKLNPEVAEYNFDLARLLFSQQKDLKGARVHIMLALDRHSGKIDYLILFGKIQAALAETADARRTFRKILSLDRDNAQAKEMLDTL